MAFCGLSGGSALPQGEHLTNGRSVTDVLFTPIRLGPLEVKNRPSGTVTVACLSAVERGR